MGFSILIWFIIAKHTTYKRVFMQPSFLQLPDKRKIAYVLSKGMLPCVIFFGGFKSNMEGAKATALEASCKARGQRFIRFDYTGHGRSSGEFQDGTIGNWKQDALAVIDNLGAEKNIFVGSSMGAWIALLAALERRGKAVGFVGISSAPDFTEKLIWERLSHGQKQQMEREKIFYAPSCYGEEPYAITLRLIEEAREHLLLDSDIALDIPVRLLHGTHDEDVPWETSVSLLQRLSSHDVSLSLLKNGDHRLSSPAHLNMLCDIVKTLCHL
jgi:pimeloyl-ACP methyl ester carboxylesterase